MKTRIIFSILFVVFINVKGLAIKDIEDTINHTCYSQTLNAVDTSVIFQTDSSNKQSCSFQTNPSNQDDNWLNRTSVFVAIIGIIIGVFTTMAGYIFSARKESIDLCIDSIKEHVDRIEKDNMGFKKDITKTVDEVKRELMNKIEEINLIKCSVDQKANEIECLAKKQEFQNNYLQRINQYLFSITNSVVDSYGGNDETASSIRNSLYNQYYIVKLFLPWSDSPIDGTEAAFRYLQVNGTIDNIDDLQFIANNDPDERKRKMAIETIGFIKARLMNGQAS